MIYYNKHTIIHHTLNFGRTLCYLLNSVLLFL
nr:MAG TPA: hypothetical protein [Caudoviricetes sp.]